MKSLSISLLLLSLCSLGSCTARGEKVAGPNTFTDIGADMSNWIQRGGKASYKPGVTGEIIGQTRPNQPNSFLCTLKNYTDFELEYNFIVDKDLNSGVQIRSQSLPDYKNGVVFGYQVEIDPSPRAFTGGIYDESRRGWLKDLKDNPKAQKAFKPGLWNHIRVLAQGDHIQTWLNGVPAADLHDSETRTGFIALQVHGVGAKEEPLEVRWRYIRIRELPPEPVKIETAHDKNHEPLK